MLVALLAVALTLGTPAMSGVNHSSGSVTAGALIAITVKGRDVAGDARGTFALIGAASDAGTSYVVGNTTSAQRVLGQRLYKGTSRGFGELDGKKGDLSFSWSGSHVPVNASTSVTTGTWRITGSSGRYKAWKGDGTFVWVGGIGTHEARFEGLVTR